MNLTSQNKLLMLFLSDGNPLWSRIAGLVRLLRTDAAFPRTRDMLMGVSDETLRQWQLGKREYACGAVEALQRLETNLNDLQTLLHGSHGEEAEKLRITVEAFLSRFQNPGTVTVCDAAKVLGMSVQQAQYAIDTVIQRTMPLLKLPYYEDTPQGRRLSEEHFSVVGGTYYAFVRRGECWLRCPLQVRCVFALPLHTRKLYFLRAKLHLPMLNPEQSDLDQAKSQGSAYPYWQHDGFVTVRGERLYWMFERRKTGGREDYFQFITDLGQTIAARRVFSGTYLTTGQDQRQSIISDRIILQRLYGGAADSSGDDPVSIMGHDTSVIEPGGEGFDQVEALNAAMA